MIFLTKAQVLRMQYANVKQFGGSQGMRDEGAFESAMNAAENRAYYEDADVVTCAATYGFHLSQAHSFVDGNKRVGAAAALIFLEINGIDFSATDDEIIEAFLNVADGKMTRDDLENFFRQRVQSTS